MQRRLAAILAADVVGYSRLMELDEAGTLAALKAHRTELIDPEVAAHNGRVVKLMGDGALVEFPSVVDALTCAVAIQQGMDERNQAVAPDKQIVFRIGINLGDVIVEGDDLYGGGVNVAARLEALAEPGGICLSGTAYDTVHGRPEIVFEDLGERKVKNLDQPVRVYRVRADDEPAVETTSADPTLPSLELPDKPSLVVLPFTNMSADPEQEFFADGITEDIITELSKFRSLFVIARNSAFSFKGQSPEVKEVSAKLGVRYLVEGSVRRAGKRVRVTAQLIDAVEDKHLWAERYDRDLEDIFAVQDEVTLAIVTTVEPQLASRERQRARRKPTDSLGAWECYQRGLWHLFQSTREDADRSLVLMDRAVKLDPSFASAQAGLAFVIYYFVLMGYSSDREADLTRALAAGKSAVMLDPTDPFGHVAFGRLHTIQGHHEAAIASCEDAISLNPSYAMAHFGRAHSLWHAGRPEEAIGSHDRAIRLSPQDPIMWAFLASKSIALTMLGRYQEALECARKATRQPNTALYAHLSEISALGHLERLDEAKAALARAEQAKPGLDLAFVALSLPITDAACREHFFAGLVKAGLS